MAAIGRQLKQSVKVFHSLMLNLRLPARTVCVTLGREGFCFLKANLQYIPQRDQKC